MGKRSEKNTKMKIATAAWKLFSERGYDETTVEDIIEAAETSRGTFYHYFESKDDVLDAMIENLMQRCFLNVMFDLHLGPEYIKESFVRIFRFWEGDDRTKLDALIRNGLESRLMTWSLQFIRAERIGILSNSNLDPKLVEIGLMVGVTDFFSLLFYWSRDGYLETPEQMAEYAIWVLPQAFFNL